MKRILFVDDDEQALAGLKIRLRGRAREWDMHFVPSGAQALEELERQSRNVLVSDVRLPAMDGVQLFREVSERWPDTVRIALSGISDPAEGMRMLPLAHQYLSKPCQPRHLETIIEKCLDLQDVLTQPALREVIGRIRQLPARPRIFARLQVVMANDQVTPPEIAQIIREDTVITAKVLQIANSAFFRRARRITSIEQAVLYLGLNGVRNLVMCAEVFARWPGKLAHAAIDLELLQQHAHRVASVAHALTSGTVWADDTVIAALLHEIGYWILAQECTEELERAVELAVAEGIPLPEAERRILGASHAEIGAYLLGLWGLPHAVVEAVAYHHQPQRARTREFGVLAALVVAQALGGTDDTDAFRSSPPRSPPVGPDYLQGLGAPFSWSEAEQRAVDCVAAADRAAG